jgi:hypothetical protein
MVRALATDQKGLAEIGKVIEDLARTPRGMELLPDGLLALWHSIAPVAQAMQE